jgi:hypothetical protein
MLFRKHPQPLFCGFARAKDVVIQQNDVAFLLRQERSLDANRSLRRVTEPISTHRLSLEVESVGRDDEPVAGAMSRSLMPTHESGMHDAA